MRLLYVHPGVVPPPQRESHDRFYFLSEICGGDVLLPIWGRSPTEAARQFGTFPEFARGRFTYHFFLDARWPRVLRTLARTSFYIRQAWRLHKRGKRYDAVMTYGTNSTGVAAVAISRLLGARLIAEIPNVPEDAYLFDKPAPGASSHFKHAIADSALSFVLRRAHHAKLLYPSQLAKYPSLHALPTSTFHDFVPVAALPPDASDGRYVLFLGHPWYLKGVDILIQAFQAIAAQVPGYRLRIVGHFPDRSRLDALAQGCSQIEIERAIRNADALTLISSCSALVLPSRTEGMGRVLLEGMAAGKPVIASRVGGIPHYITDADNGFLTTPGSIPELSARLLDLLTNPELSRRFGERGRQLARTKYDEKAYVGHFGRMLSRMGFTLSGNAEGHGLETPDAQ